MIKQRNLGQNGPLVSSIGYGAMGLEGYYGGTEESSALSVIRHALEVGCSFIDTADAYGNGHNEELVARAVPPIVITLLWPPNSGLFLTWIKLVLTYPPAGDFHSISMERQNT